MNKSVKCILTLEPFGRVSTAAKSHDAKNKNICRNCKEAYMFQTDVMQVGTHLFTIRGGTKALVVVF